MNNVFSIFTKPRETFKRVMENRSMGIIILLAVLAGIATALANNDRMKDFPGSLPWPAALLVEILFGAIGGLLSLYVGSAIMYMIGKWFKGEAFYKDVMAASAWSQMPNIFTLPLFLLAVLLLGRAYYDDSYLGGNPGLAILIIFLAFLQFAAGIWSYIIWLFAFSEAQHFSVLKAFLCSLVAFALAFLIAIIVFTVFLLPAIMAFQ